MSVQNNINSECKRFGDSVRCDRAITLNVLLMDISILGRADILTSVKSAHIIGACIYMLVTICAHSIVGSVDMILDNESRILTLE